MVWFFGTSGKLKSSECNACSLKAQIILVSFCFYYRRWQRAKQTEFRDGARKITARFGRMEWPNGRSNDKTGMAEIFLKTCKVSAPTRDILTTRDTLSARPSRGNSEKYIRRWSWWKNQSWRTLTWNSAQIFIKWLKYALNHYNYQCWVFDAPESSSVLSC